MINLFECSTSFSWFHKLSNALICIAPDKGQWHNMTRAKPKLPRMLPLVAMLKLVRLRSRTHTSWIMSRESVWRVGTPNARTFVRSEDSEPFVLTTSRLKKIAYKRILTFRTAQWNTLIVWVAMYLIGSSTRPVNTTVSPQPIFEVNFGSFVGFLLSSDICNNPFYITKVNL